MIAIELSDPDGEAATITRDTNGIWLTCTAGEAEVTVGPLPVASLISFLTESGHYERNT